MGGNFLDIQVYIKFQVDTFFQNYTKKVNKKVRVKRIKHTTTPMSTPTTTTPTFLLLLFSLAFKENALVHPPSKILQEACSCCFFCFSYVHYTPAVKKLLYVKVIICIEGVYNVYLLVDKKIGFYIMN